MLRQSSFTHVNNVHQLEALGFKRYNRMRPYVPEYFVCDGAAGDYADIVFRHPQTKQLVTLSVSREFGIFHITLGDTRGKNKFS